MLETVTSHISRAKKIVSAFQRINRASRDHGRLSLGWDLIREGADEVTFTRSGITWTMGVNDVIGRMLYVDDCAYFKTMAPLLKLLNERPTWRRPFIVNVGANVGTSAIPLVRRTGKTCLAFEPMPRTFAALGRNVVQNVESERVICRQVAVGSEAGRVEMLDNGDTGQSEVRSASGQQGVVMGSCVKRVTVECAPLDTLVGSLGHKADDVALVWSDTQGFETHVIDGGSTLWASGTPLWAEVWPKALAAHGGVNAFVDSCRRHFRTFLTDEDLLLPVVPSPRPIQEFGAMVDRFAKVQATGSWELTDALLMP